MLVASDAITRGVEGMVLGNLRLHETLDYDYEHRYAEHEHEHEG